VVAKPTAFGNGVEVAQAHHYFSRRGATKRKAKKMEA